MGWATFKHQLNVSAEDHTREVIYRAAARAIPQVTNSLGTTRASGEAEEPALIALFRGLMTVRVALDKYDAASMTASWSAATALERHNNSFSYLVRAVRYALVAAVPGKSLNHNEGVRRALQAASDLSKNTVLIDPSNTDLSSITDVWEGAEHDLDAIKKGMILNPPLPLDYLKTSYWRRFERELSSFDVTWEVWLIWLRYRLFGLASDEVPPQIWAKVERQMVFQPEEFWRDSIVSINAGFAKIVVEAVDAALQDEVDRTQSRLGLTFYVSEEGRFDIQPQREEKEGDIKIRVAQEVLRNAQELLALCNGNTNAHLKDRVIQYLEVLDNGVWSDDMLIVMRGDTLRKELKFQLDRDEDSDIPPVSQATVRSLEQTVRMHNMLVNSHPSLASLDRMLLGPEGEGDKASVGGLRDLIASAEARDIISARARQELESAAKELNDRALSEREAARVKFTMINLIRTAIAYVWKQKATIGKVTGGVSAGVGTGYGIGHWLVTNEAMVRLMFTGNPTMRVVLGRIFEFLHKMPLL